MEMDMLIAAGCPRSGWEMTLPVLAQIGFEADGIGTRWLDQLCQSAGVADPLQLRQPLVVEFQSAEQLSALMASRQNGPLFCADSRNLWLLDFWAERFPEAQFLLFYTRLETAIACAFLAGVEPRSFLNGWQAANQHLLAFKRRHRQRAFLLNAEAAWRHPRALIELCQTNGLVVQTPPSVSAGPPPALPAEGLLAGSLLATEPDARFLQAELEASAHPLGDTAPLPWLQPDELFVGYLQRQSAEREQSDRQKRLQGEVERLTRDCEEQKKTADDRQALLQKLERERAEQVRQVADRQVQLEKIEQARQAMEVTYKETGQENELLFLQLHQVQEELEAVLLQKQQLEQAYQHAERSLQELKQGQERQEDEGPTTAKPGKITALTRTLARPFKPKEKDRLKEQVKLLKNSGLFDEAWYLGEYPDVASSGMDPVRHYLRFGVAEGRNPSPRFDTHFYLQAYRDVSDKGINPLVHFVLYGKAEGRRATIRG
ncbi:MAG: hypothetical protein FIB02_10665 [Desulfuromonas sp.]|nr:hypothetical protein [Desulfuromonas sp.]